MPPNTMYYFDLLPDHVLKKILSHLDIHNTNHMMFVSVELKQRILSRLNLTQLKYQNCMRRWQNNLNSFDTETFRRIEWPNELITLYCCSTIFVKPTDFRQAFHTEYFPLATTFRPRVTSSLTYMQCIRRMSTLSFKSIITTEHIIEFLKMAYLALHSLRQMNYYYEFNAPNPTLTWQIKREFLYNLTLKYKDGASIAIYLQELYTDMMSRKVPRNEDEAHLSELVNDTAYIFYVLSSLVSNLSHLNCNYSPVEVSYLTKFGNLRELNIVVNSAIELQRILKKMSFRNRISLLHVYSVDPDDAEEEVDPKIFNVLEKYKRLTNLAFKNVSFISIQSMLNVISNSYRIEHIGWQTDLDITTEEVCEMLDVGKLYNKTIKRFCFNNQCIMENRKIQSTER